MSMGTRIRRHPFSFRGDDGDYDNSNNPSIFPHSSDDDDDDNGPALDEQEQEALIASLAAQNDRRNGQFRMLLLTLPFISAVPFLLAIFFSSSPPSSSSSGSGSGGKARDFLTCLLALSSLGGTAWNLWFLEPGVTGLGFLDRWSGGGGGGSGSEQQRGRAAGEGGRSGGLLQVPAVVGRSRGSRRGSSASSQFSAWFPQPRTPLEVYLPYLNLGLCGFLGLLALLSAAAGGGRGNSGGERLAVQHWGHVSLGYLPGLVHLVVLAAKVMMGSVDPERELGGLRYDYKGA